MIRVHALRAVVNDPKCHLRTTNASEQVLFQGWNMWKVHFSDFTGGIHTDLRILPVDFTGGIQGEAFVDLRWTVMRHVNGNQSIVHSR